MLGTYSSPATIASGAEALDRVRRAPGRWWLTRGKEALTERAKSLLRRLAEVEGEFPAGRRS